ncbi:pyochelin biosynthetic protein PchG [Kitasatospora sp. MAP12-15]|uniref:Gfo/Idh/MocA family oxidoreductase n=1 Tax=unclassified Kitasatospora TaxID=2633591 RepID=UPI0024759D7C|nr:Gfo/Idh/MocA family oxidoreductase [Kitasatospora sp. MAP12-44]MDH6108773.1 pyochelin biosynthetic protein PchG [Kitasatospora sp. MAP12-44]
MTGSAPGALRTVVCGTVFGRFYLEALRTAPPASPFELTGVLAGGGARSRACAAEYGVPYYTRVDQLPEDTDVACVVVRSAVAGGPGGELAQALLARGVHVLQEQPAHPDEVAACLRLARTYGVRYRLNSFYPHVEPVRRFLAAARSLRALRTVQFVDAACSSQVLFPLLDILGRALGGLGPWAFTDPAPVAEVRAATGVPVPFRLVHGVIAGVPLTLRVQNQLDPGDPDNHAHLLHRVSLGTDAGTLTLADTHGPVLWSPRLHVGRDADGQLALDGPGTGHLDQPTTTLLGAEQPQPFRRTFGELWPAAVRLALDELRAAIAEDGQASPGGQYTLTVSRMWLDLTTRLGRPELISGTHTPPVHPADLTMEPA